MPDHVLKSSLLPKLLIKRNFNSPIFIYRPPINPKRFKIARSKMMASPSKTHSSGIRSCNDAIRSDSVALYRSPFVPFFFPPLPLPWRCFKRVVACSTILPRVVVQQVRLPVDPTAFQPPTKYSANISAVLILFFFVEARINIYSKYIYWWNISSVELYDCYIVESISMSYAKYFIA